MFTYRDLIKALKDMPDDRLDDSATVYDHNSDDYYGVLRVSVTPADSDVLDPGHTFITMDN